MIPRLLAAALVFALSLTAARAEPPRVVVSIKPVHSLVAAVMEGVAEPELLIKGAGSPHGFSLRPSDARLISDAGLVFWIGPGLEASLAKPFAALARDGRLVTLSEADGLDLLATRQGGTWGEEHEEHEEHKEHETHDHGEHDLHAWLDPVRAKALTEAVAHALSKADPGNAAAYEHNSGRTLARLDALTGDLRARLAPVSDKPYLVYHDAYQYLEARFGLHAVGSITATAGHGVGAGRLSALGDLIAAEKIVCLFTEPQFRPKLADVLAERGQVRIGTLDPLGAALPPGPDQYFLMMRDLADALSGCLEGES